MEAPTLILLLAETYSPGTKRFSLIYHHGKIPEMNSRKLLNRLMILILLTGVTIIPRRVASGPPNAPTTVQKASRQISSKVCRTDVNSPEAKRIYVDRDATGASNGDSWADAYTDLQDALEVVAYGDEIWVAEGIYTPTAGVTRTATFTLVNGVALYGGFAGTETGFPGESLRKERDWEAHVTVLSGDLDGNDTTDANGVITNTSNIAGSNAYRIVTGGGVTETAVLDGFTITGGYRSVKHTRGGGMYNANSNPMLINVTFIGNYAGNGGGMYNEDNSNPVLTNVTFSGNKASGYGGGMYNDNSSPVLTDVTIHDNKSDEGGGGMSNQENSAPVLTDVTFSDNDAGYAGGMVNNSSTLTLVNVIFSGNKASSRGTGGGMHNNNSNLTLTNVVFNDNRASTLGGGHGGGMYNDHSSLVLTNVTFSDNRTNSDGSGGGMHNFASDARLTNCILWGNRVGSGETEMAQITNVSSAITVTYSLIQSATLYTGAGIIDADPQFVAVETGDLHLSANSPAIDAGDNNAITVAFDLDGNSRRRDMPNEDTGSGAVPIVDMGAYEVSPPPPVISLDGPTTGEINTPYTFTAAISPLTTTTPITYSWQATGQLSVTRADELSDTAAFTWTMTGEQLITVTATNIYDMVTATHTIAISHRVYLPLVMRNL